MIQLDYMGRDLDFESELEAATPRPRTSKLTMTDSIVAELRKIPPVTRFLTLSLVGTTVPYLLNLISPYTLLYHPSAVFGKLQIWRLCTSFFFGSAGINFIFEVAMLYQTSNTLESS
ncbi:DER1-domain-containing protein [Hymenopellis radicata]|nr:DER1-domain-containing protein [Hymenopellis radicata]